MSGKLEKRIIAITKGEIKSRNLKIQFSDTLMLDLIKRVLYSGVRSETISNELAPIFSNIPKKELELIVRTIIFITQTNFIRVRSEEYGLHWYRWAGAGSCPKHKHMKNTFINWNTPPTPEILKDKNAIVPYHAGTYHDCKCYPDPIVSLDYIKPPYKVYNGTEIIKLVKKKFIEMYGKI